MEYKIATVSLHDCISKEVIDNAGNACGEIKDFLIDTEKLTTAYVLIAEGGFMGTSLGTDYLIAPIKDLRLNNPQAAQLTLSVSKQKLKEAPKFPKSGLKKQDNQLLDEISAYYGLKRDITNQEMLTDEAGEHESYEGSSQVTENNPAGNSKISDEVDYDKMKGYKK